MGCCSSAAQLNPEPPTLPQGIRRIDLTSPKSDVDAFRLMMARSFAGSKACPPEPANSWCWDPSEADDPFGPLNSDPTAQRVKFMEWITASGLALGLSHGGCFAVAEGGQMVAGAICFPPCKGHPWDPKGCAMMGLLCKVGLPPAGSKPNARMEALVKVMEKLLKTSMPDPHWHVLALGTSPDAQNRGHGSKLLQFLCSLADLTCSPMYLETGGPRLEEYYSKKGGFETAEKAVVQCGKEAFDANGGLTAMVRRAKN